MLTARLDAVHGAVDVERARRAARWIDAHDRGRGGGPQRPERRGGGDRFGRHTRVRRTRSHAGRRIAKRRRRRSRRSSRGAVAPSAKPDQRLRARDHVSVDPSRIESSLPSSIPTQSPPPPSAALIGTDRADVDGPRRLSPDAGSIATTFPFRVRVVDVEISAHSGRPIPRRDRRARAPLRRAAWSPALPARLGDRGTASRNS